MEQAKSFANDELGRLRDENLQLQTLLSDRENDPSAHDFVFNSHTDGEESARQERRGQFHDVNNRSLPKVALIQSILFQVGDSSTEARTQILMREVSNLHEQLQAAKNEKTEV